MQDGSVGPKLKSGKGARFIILHAGGENGIIPGAALVFKSTVSSVRKETTMTV